jgi:cyanate permease
VWQWRLENAHDYTVSIWVPLSADDSAHGISIALGFAALHPSGFKANYMDVTRAHSGVVSGIGNTIASLASSIGPIAVAKMKDSTGSWAPAFGSVAGLNILAMLIFLTMSSATPFEVDAAASARKDK